MFLSNPPKVKLVNYFNRAYENAVATARTCYSGKGIVTVEDVSGDAETDPDKKRLKEERRDALALSIYNAGHHTTLQHGHFQFAIENVSRHFIWAFLHAHPYYNSEQVSQRYVEVKPGSCIVPLLKEPALSIYNECVARQMEDYKNLIEVLMGPTKSEYEKIFRARKDNKKYDKDVKKKAQEIARYVLPIGTTAFLYHTISGITLLRYWRVANSLDATTETKIVVKNMIDELLKVDPNYEKILKEPLPFDEVPPKVSKKFKEDFDRSLDGYTSKLVDYKINNERSVADSVREVFGLNLSDEEALSSVLDPSKNRVLGESMNLTTLTKLSRCLFHASYTFRKKLSHTADSQDQRHRMTPASRPLLLAYTTEEPDYETPMLIRSDEKASLLYESSMIESWKAYGKLIKLGVPEEYASYILPNALSIRFTESADLLNLHHKMKMRLCYNAQEEIWRASLDETNQISEINPTIGKYLLPPCGLRKLSKSSPICPEGDRYCGVPVWRLDKKDYKRTI